MSKVRKKHSDSFKAKPVPEAVKKEKTMGKKLNRLNPTARNNKICFGKHWKGMGEIC